MIRLDAVVLAWVAAILAVVRGAILVAQKEFIALLTAIAVFLVSIAVAVGNIKF